jgi:YjbE family integral membrane protein
MLATLSDPDIWTALFKIAVINVVLSGDNAVVIALACRGLSPAHQRKAFIVGAGGIVVLMTILTACAAMLMTLPWIQAVGSVLLIWIGIKLLLPEDDGSELGETQHFWSAVKTIIVADIVMSLDNVLGMAGAAKGHLGMLFLGLVITMPLILFGSALMMRMMERFPMLVTAGAALLGYVAGEMAVDDIALHDHIVAHAAWLETALPIACAIFVVAVGKLMAGRRPTAAAPASLERGAASSSSAGDLQPETAR